MQAYPDACEILDCNSGKHTAGRVQVYILSFMLLKKLLYRMHGVYMARAFTE